MTTVKKPAAPEQINLPTLKTQTVEITLIGDSPLIMHAFSEKAIKMIEETQSKKAKQGREARDPRAEFEAATHWMPDGMTPCFPAIGFKAAAVTACTSIAGITKVEARQAFHIDADMIPILSRDPKMRTDRVRIGMGTTDLRYRPEFWPWAAIVPVTFNVNALSLEQILNLYNTAGFGVGVGEWRPERDGDKGRFHCGTQVEIERFMKDLTGAKPARRQRQVV